MRAFLCQIRRFAGVHHVDEVKFGALGSGENSCKSDGFSSPGVRAVTDKVTHVFNPSLAGTTRLNLRRPRVSLTVQACDALG